MNKLAKLIALFTAALTLTTPSTAQADPGTNLHQASSGSIEVVGRTTCSWSDVPIEDPPAPVSISNIPLTCTNGFWGELGELSMTYDGTIIVFDFSFGFSFFWCRYQRTSFVLTGGPPTYTGSFQIPLHSSNWSSQCSNPANINIWVNIYQR